MRIYLINLERRPDRRAAMAAKARALGLELERVAALDAAVCDRNMVAQWFMAGGPLGEIPLGDKACLLSHRAAWNLFLASGEAHGAFLEDDVRLAQAARHLLADGGWIPDGIMAVKLEHYGPLGQRVLVSDLRGVEMQGQNFQLGRMLSRHTGAAAYILSRQAARLLLARTRFDLPVDHLLFNPNNSPVFAALSPWQLLPAIARQDAETSDIEATRKGLRAFGPRYLKRELVRLGYDLKLVPRQVAALLKGAKFVAVKTAD